MPPQGNPTPTPPAPPPTPAPKNLVPLVLGSIVAVLFVGVGLYLFTVTQGLTSPIGGSQTPSNLLLGTWQMLNASSTPIDVFKGFLKDGTERDYNGQPSASTIYGFSRWRIVEEGSSTILEITSQSDTTFDFGYRYKIEHISPTQLALDWIGKNDGRHIGSYQFNKVGSAQEELNRFAERTEEENDALCSEILFGTSSASAVLPLSCNEHIGPSTDVTLTVSKEGDVTITRNGLTINSFSSTTGSIELASNGPLLYHGDVSLVDLTFDGYVDLQVKASSGPYNAFYLFYAYKPSLGRFEKLDGNLKQQGEGASDWVNPTIDSQAQTITTRFRGRGLGDFYGEATFHWQDGAYVLVQTVSQDDATYLRSIGKAPKDMPADASYVRTTKEFKNGEMIKTKIEYFVCEDIWPDDPHFCPTGNFG